MAAVVATGYFEPYESQSLDRLFRFRGSIAVQAPIAIVDITADTLTVLRASWPLPRKTHGEVIERLSEAGAAVIGVDLLLSEPSVHGDADDEAFTDSLRRVGGVVLAAGITTVSENEPATNRPWYFKTDPNLPLAGLRGAVSGVGYTNQLADSDGSIRRAFLRAPFAHAGLHAFAVELHKVAATKGIIGQSIPSDPDITINFVGPPLAFPHVSYHRVLDGALGPNALRGRVVLIGTTSHMFHDIYRTPFTRSTDMPGVEIHANILHTLLTGRRIKEQLPLWGQALSAAVCAACAALFVGPSGVRGPALVVGASMVFGVVAMLVFKTYDLWLPSVGPMAGLAFGTVARLLFRGNRD